MNATPAEVKLILIDPKRVELAQYKGIPHLLCEVIVEPDKAVNALKWTVGTMESRYHEFAARGVRNIAGYNEALRAGQPRMPYIVIIIDELADLMMVSRLRGRGHHHPHRAAGAGHRHPPRRRHPAPIGPGHHRPHQGQHPEPHRLRDDLRASTRAPSSTRPARRTCSGAATCSTSRSTRRAPSACRACSSPTPRSRRSRATGARQGGPQYRPEITAPRRDGKEGGRPGEEDEDDDADALFTQAVDIVRRSDKASASLLQRRLRIGYARAARILDQMEDRGIVGPADGSRFREVLVTSDGWGGDVGPDEDDEP